MFLVRNVFHAKPGKAKELAAILTNASQHMHKVGVNNTKVLTDVATTFWTVVLQGEVEDLNAYVDMAKTASKNPELSEAMKGYADLVDNGFREIYRIES